MIVRVWQVHFYENMSAVTKIGRYCCSAEDPTKYSAANDANIVTTKAVIQTTSEEDGTLPEESADPVGKVGSRLSNSTTADNPSADNDDGEEDDDRVVFNAGVLCSAHGEKQTQFSVVSASQY